jgi:hypothetical protein
MKSLAMTLLQKIKSSYLASGIEYDQDLESALRLVFFWHWMLCFFLCLTVFVFKDWQEFLNNPMVTLITSCCLGWLLGFVSCTLLVRLAPKPYAWLERRVPLIV